MPKHVVKTIFMKFTPVLAGAVMVLAVIAPQLTSAEAQEKAQKAALPPLAEILSDRISGKADAPVTIIEYASKTCPHCANFHTGTLPALKKEFIDTGKVKLIYRDFPLDGLALAAAMMARCAPKERYFPIVDIMYRTQQNWSRAADPNAALAQIGLLSGISKETIQACISSKDVHAGVMKIRGDGDKQYKVASTPTIIINGETFKGPATIERLRKVLDAELVKAKK